MSTIRADLRDRLAQLLPARYKIVDSQRTVDVTKGPRVILRQEEFTRNPAAPMGSMLVSFTLVVTTAHEDISKAEDDLDESVADLLEALDKIPWLAWTTATKQPYEDVGLAYDIKLQVTT